jgi:hypothetical protein
MQPTLHLCGAVRTLGLGIGLGASGSGGGGSQWTPIDMSPQVWVRSDETVTTGAGKATAWTSITGGWVFNTNVGIYLPPDYVAGVYDGKPAIRGTDATRSLFCAPLVGPGTSSTRVYVCSPSTLSLSYIASAAGGGAAAILDRFTSTEIEWLNGSDRYTIATAPSAGLHQIIITQVDGVSLVGYFDGVQAFSVVPVSTGNVAGSFLFGFGGGANGTNADIVEHIVAPGSANLATVAKLHAYSQRTWSTP